MVKEIWYEFGMLIEWKLFAHRKLNF